MKPSVQKELNELNEAFGNLLLEYDAIELIELAQDYCKLQEKACNECLNDSDLELEKELEAKIEVISEKYLLRAEFSGDPRGFTVKLHNSKNDGPFNTWGGQECGYGIGENSCD